MTIKLTIVPEGAGNNKTYEYSSYEELLDFVTSKIEVSEEVEVEEVEAENVEPEPVKEVDEEAPVSVEVTPDEVVDETVTVEAPAKELPEESKE